MASPYRPLDAACREIRLLTVCAGAHEHPLSCSLRHISLDDPPPYETVSYCWGDVSLRASVEVDGQIIDVSKNAARAIQRLRFEQEDRNIWIDAVCINQNDIEERGQQVADMHSIYHRATRNCVWLGEEDDTVQNALTVMQTVLDEAKLETDNFRTFFDDIYDTEGNVQPSLSGFMSRFDAEPLLHFFRRPWFQRLWVVQEAALSPLNIAYCGPYEFPMLDLLRSAAFLYSKRNHLVSDVRTNPGLYNAATVGELADPENGREARIQRDADKVKLSSLLRKLQRFQTMDPRDHLYGVLGLYRHYLPYRKLPMLLEPDYTKGVMEVLRDGTKYSILDQGSLEPLNKVSHWPDEDADFPSWVPRWHRKWNSEKDTSGLVAYFNTSDGFRAQVAYSRFGSPSVLSLKGILPFPSGSEVSATSSSYSSVNDARVLIEEAKSIIVQHAGALTVYEDLQSAMSTTLLGNRNLESQPLSKPDIAGLTAFEEYHTEIGSNPPPIRTLNAFSQDCDPVTWRASRFLSAFWRASKLRRFFVTGSGHIGIGPQAMRAGDIIAVLYGGYTPFVLRPAENQFDLVGECYVHGIMDGEAVRRSSMDGERDTIFHIK